MKKLLASLLAITLLAGCEEVPADQNAVEEVETIQLSDSEVVEKYLMWKDSTFENEEEELKAKPTDEELERLKNLDINGDGNISPTDYVKLKEAGR